MSAVSCQKYKYLPACAFIEISSDMFVSLKGNTTEISIGVLVKFLTVLVVTGKTELFNPPTVVMLCKCTALKSVFF